MVCKVQVIHEQIIKYMSFYMQKKGSDYWAVDNLSEPLIFQVQNKCSCFCYGEVWTSVLHCMIEFCYNVWLNTVELLCSIDVIHYMVQSQVRKIFCVCKTYVSYSLLVSVRATDKISPTG